MKELFSKDFPVGSDGKGSAGLVLQDGMLMADVKVGYPVIKILEPIKVNLVDKLKALIPGDWDDKLIDQAWNESVAFLSEAPATAIAAAKP